MAYLRTAFTSLMLLSGCGYQFGKGELPNNYQTISVPYAEGDVNGAFTAELIKQIALSGAFNYVRTGGDLILKATLSDFHDEDIGLRYYREKDGKLTRETIPVEGRLFVTAEIEVIDALTGVVVLGPAAMQATTDFDHDFYSTRDNINVFSLGQLTDFDGAYDAALRPLNESLARKVTDFISDSW